MAKIAKKMQPKHKETLSPWLQSFVASTVSTPLPLLPQTFETFPSKWPFPRGDLFHWIPLLNRFDNILECFVGNYHLDKGPQTQDFSCDLLLGKCSTIEYGGEGQHWDEEALRGHGFGSDGDRQLLEAVLGFTRMLLDNCGNRSIYSSSAHLNHLLHTTSMSLLQVTLSVGSELARRYQASLKRLGRNQPQQQVTAALLANHYNMSLEAVHQLAMPFVRTPVMSLSEPFTSSTPVSTSKSKDRSQQGQPAKNAASMYANDLVSIAASDAGSWKGWGDVKILYYPHSAQTDTQPGRRSAQSVTSTPATPTPLRRSSTMNSPTPKSSSRGAMTADDGSPSTSRTPGFPGDDSAHSPQKTFELSESTIKSTPIHALVAQFPPDLPESTRYELLHRLRIAKALTGSAEDRQRALSVRLLAILNLINIHPEAVFVEKVLRHDIDETRRFQLAYQLADLIHPTANGTVPVPIPVQSIALSLLEALSGLQCRFADVVSALNATVNHGILLYVMRTAVAGMKEDTSPDTDERLTEMDEWRGNLFSLASQLTANPNMKIGGEMLSSGLMDVLVEILGLRSAVAMRHHHAILLFLDTLIWTYSHGLEAFFNSNGLDAVAKLAVSTVEESIRLTEAGRGTPPDHRTSAVDYEIPFYHHSTLKSVLRFVHYIMSNWYSHGGNADRLLRNLADKSDLLHSLRAVIEGAKRFGPSPWTSASSILSDFINNDPTSFAAISESGLITAFLTAVTGRPVPPVQQDTQPENDNGDAPAATNPEQGPEQSGTPVVPDADDRPHPPTAEMLSEPRPSEVAGSILASYDAISTIPVVLNAICLNNSGLRMVIASRVFESYFEIFESPAHVRCMDGDYNPASNLGRNFDELARHHPALRTPMSNAAIDAVARVVHLGKDKARIAEWGVKLQVLDSAQNPVQADAEVTKHLAQEDSGSSGHRGRVTDDPDVEMADHAENEDKSGEADDAAEKENRIPPFEPFVYVLCNFLTTYLSSSSLKIIFVNKGGIELLLDILESPSLTHTFGEHLASRTIQHVISGLVEHNPVLALPSVLRRTQAAIDYLSPLANEADGEIAFFAPFLKQDLCVSAEDAAAWSPDTVAKMEQGSGVARALLNAQSLIKTLCDCFAPSPRSNSLLLHPVNVFDYYVSLINSLGPLLRASLLEESAHHDLVPRHWLSNRRPFSSPSDYRDPATNVTPATGPDTGEAGGTAAPTGGAEGPTDPSAGSAGGEEPTLQPSEKKSVRYKNFDTLRLLLHSMMPTAYPLFQSLGKALLPRRDRDKYSRSKHLGIAIALADSVLSHLEVSVNASEDATPKDYHYWIIMMHTIHEMLVDTSRPSERSPQLLMPVLLAFKERGGFTVLNTMLRSFMRQVGIDNAAGATDSTKAKVASFGMRKILDLYVLVVNGKYVCDSTSQFNLPPRAERPTRDSTFANNLVVELRLLILPVINELWQSDLIESISDQTVVSVVDILNLISAAEQEPQNGQRVKKSSTSIFNAKQESYDWSNSRYDVTRLVEAGYEEGLAVEAIYRSNGNYHYANEYCKAHKSGIAGGRHPVPVDDAYTPAEPEASMSDTHRRGTDDTESMAVDPAPEGESAAADDAHSAEEDDDESSQATEENQDTPAAGPDSQANGASRGQDTTQSTASKDQGEDEPDLQAQLDELRAHLREGLIDKALDVLRAHPASAIDISELIRTMVFRHKPSDEVREEVGATLANALSSLAMDDEEKAANGRSIASYAHLLALLLQDGHFFLSNTDTLREKVDEYLGFLKVPSASSNDELPPWIPFILLVLETLLQFDERPRECKWDRPLSVDDPVVPPTLTPRKVMVPEDSRMELLESALEILPRIGKDEALATAILRVLVILTRHRPAAQQLGERKNLQRLFVMVKQLSVLGAENLKSSKINSWIMVILRHIVEDEETTAQIIKAEIQSHMSGFNRPQRRMDIHSYIQNLASTATRAPEMFVDVSANVIKIDQWIPSDPHNNRNPSTLVLKEAPAAESNASESGDVDHGENQKVSSALTDSEDVKESTETGDKEMMDAPKEAKRPVVENPDGVVHFLLCELLNYKEVDDKENASPPMKDLKAQDTSSSTSESSGPSPATPDEPSTTEASDKKIHKPVFKPEEHPIFVYRSFLLNSLAELLQSYNRTKMEFLSFKRSVPPQLGSTPVRPRSSIVNYLIDLLCHDSLNGTSDTIVSKKRTATAARASSVLVALVTRSGEKVQDRTRDRFEYDDDPDLLFVRKFVLDTILKTFERAGPPDESLDVRYARMQSLAELMCHIIGDKEKDHPTTHRSDMHNAHVHAQLRRMMYEKGYLEKLTTSIAEIDLKYPGVKRVIKYILRVLRILTETAKDLSLTSNAIPTSSLPEYVEDEIASASSLSDLEDEREETPDLYRNSALGMLEPRDSDDESEEDEDDEDDGYGDEDEYGDEMDYDEDGLSSHDDDNVSDEDEELGEMGPIEGLHGDPVLEVIVGDDDDMDEDEDEEDTSAESDDEDDEMDSDEFEDGEDRVHIAVEENDLMEDDGNPDWESATESQDEDDEALGFDAEGPMLDDDLHHHHHHHHGHLSDGEILGNITRAVIGGGTDFEPDDVDDLGDAYIDDGRDDDEDEEDEDLDDDEYPYDEDYPHPVPAMMPPALGWDTLMVDPPQLAANAHTSRRHRQRGNAFGQGWTLAPTPRDFNDYRGGLLHRSNAGRMNQAGGSPDDGTNPLLRRPATGREASPRPGGPPGSFAVRVHSDLIGGAERHFGGPIAILHDLIAAIPQVSHVTWAGGTRGPPVPIFGDPRRDPRDIPHPYRDGRSGARGETAHTDPNHAVAFAPVSTRQRHEEEATMLFASRFPDRCQALIPQILYRLVPAAIEKKKEEDAEKAKRKEERLAREAEEARIKKEEEERQAEEARLEEARLAAEAAEAAGAARAAEVEAQSRQQQEEPRAASPFASATAHEENVPGHDAGAQPMEGVETTTAPEPTLGSSGEALQERVLTTIRGEEVDVTELGIDPDYLAALPEEFREEVIAQTVSSRRSQARDENAPRGEPQTEVFQEFLDALPAELRVEIIQQERQEQRRRNDEEQRRQVQPSGVDPVAADMDAASILLTLPPELRDEVLLEQGEEILDQLPPDMAAQARALAERRQPRHTVVRGSTFAPPSTTRVPGNVPVKEGAPEEKVARRTVIQMLDKSGVATLLRLMFIALQGHTRSYLFGVFSDICENKQNRLEVISTLLQILQDGSTDMDAIERSFGHLSLKAKRPKDKENDMRTPQSIKRSLTTLSATAGNIPTQSYSEISPLLIVQQCLDLLVDLLAKNPHISHLFLTEHDIVGSSIKRLSSRKGKAKDTKAQKYAINSLLSLLDRELVMESSNIMGLLADLLNRLTLPLQNLERRRREAEEAAKKAEETKASEKATAEEKKEGEGEEGSSSAALAAPTQSPPEGGDNTRPTEVEASTELEKKQGGPPEKPKAKTMQMPVIPHYNLTLVIKVFVARECSSKTFQNTIAAIKNLSVIPEAKAVFGQELVKQAQLLSQNIVSDLDELLPQITKASSGTEIQGVALAKFSPGASEQNKLLRVLTALDHLFEPKKAEPEDERRAATRETEKQDLISTLYHHPTFLTMWEKLSACLAAIRQRENMLNVATILLPLIESLMAICKNAATTDESQSQSQGGKELVLTSPPPDSPMAGLFFTFTEEHRRILNDLVRNNPKLMQGPFKLLVKNPKVLEFDNKRNYFNRSVHSRGGQGRTSYQPLQLSVRREHVFHDSFKSLYFKSGEEMKYGKLNIRFHGEEGVDAGGVTREWFQVLSRQMFNPNYALFIPVSSDRTTFHPNKLSGINDEHLRFFKFIGRVIGKALYEGRVLDCYFSRAVYKRILGKSVSVKDMESFDPDYYKSLVWMLDNDITDIITETFSVEDDEFGKITVVDLVPDGRNIPVTEENKHDYVRLVVEHKLLSSVKEQMEHFLTGFHDIIPAGLISIFNEQELELLISGLPDIDVDDWKGNTEYQNYTASSPQIQWFWRAVRSFDKEERAKLLQFVTGTSKVPLNGFKELEGMNGINRFNIHRDYGNKTRLPSSHTCFNQLDLPEYESYDMLRKQVMKAITAGSEYFGFA